MQFSYGWGGCRAWSESGELADQYRSASAPGHRPVHPRRCGVPSRAKVAHAW